MISQQVVVKYLLGQFKKRNHNSPISWLDSLDDLRLKFEKLNPKTKQIAK